MLTTQSSVDIGDFFSGLPMKFCLLHLIGEPAPLTPGACARGCPTFTKHKGRESGGMALRGLRRLARSLVGGLKSKTTMGIAVAALPTIPFFAARACGCEQAPTAGPVDKKASPRNAGMPLSSLICGGGGIRTPGTLPYNSFQDCRHRPLGHTSGKEYKDSKKYGFLLQTRKNSVFL